ncbi:MAG: AAA family ATPase [Verrucomicrobiota bacterium]|jgi:hypothetical protein
MTTSTFHTGIIPPEAVAYKLAAWKNFKTPQFAEQAKTFPRLPELAWFIQWQSMQAGSVEKFVTDLLAAFPDRVCTPSMLRYGKETETYTGEQRKVIMYEIPRYYEDKAGAQAAGVAAEFWGETEIWERDGSAPRPNIPHRSKLNRAEFSALCHKVALDHLARHLRDFCNCGIKPKEPYARVETNDEKYGFRGDWLQDDKPLANVWYFQDLPGALIEMLDIHAARARQSLVMTEVAKRCFDGLEYAWTEKAMVAIEGNSRFGKTQSVRTWSQMLPGQARLVRTPCSNSEYDLLHAIAESLGLEVTLQTGHRELKTRVEFVIRHGGLMFILDEGHFLIPTRFCKNTPPARLNWVRTRIVDQGCPLVLVSTPQDFKQCLNRFIRATGYNVDQWIGRTLFTVRLPAELETADLIAVARKQFPDLDDDYLDLIVGKALQSESFLMAVESIAKRARWIGSRAGHAAPTLQDLETAIAEVGPAPATPARPAPTTTAPARPHPLAVKREPPAPVVEHSRGTPAIRRQIAPVLSPPAAGLESPSRGLIPELETVN